MQIKQIAGQNLTNALLNNINEAVYREWKISPYTTNKLSDTIFFLLMDGDEMLAMGGVKSVDQVIFENTPYDLLGYVEVISNKKGQGFGKMVVTKMREFCINEKKTSIGFTQKKNIGFYEKCGFKIEENSTKRFVYLKGSEKVTDQHDQVIFYTDGPDKFFENILSKKDGDIFLPTDGLW